jgi:DNA-binding winged helix-turn-helix (wHTH) protein
VVSRDCFRVTKEGEARKITPRAFEVLVYLIESRERVVEKQELFEQVWKGTFVSDNALTRMIKEIRHVIGDDADAPRYIQTVPKRGYRFIGELIAEAPTQPLDDAQQADEYATGRLVLPASTERTGNGAVTREDHRACGQSALSRGAWAEAFRHFEAALGQMETPEIWAGLGLAAWWLDDEGMTFKARERAYLLYRERSDPRGAARIATLLAWDCAVFRGDMAIANGWLQRAQRLLEDVPTCAEYGYLLLRRASNALFHEEDPEQALSLAGEAACIGRDLHVADLELAALAIQGVAKLCAGKIEAGIQLLDEVTAALVAGEMSEMPIIAMTACNLISGCERIRDYDRAAEWCRNFKEVCQRVENRSLFAICRTQYAEVLMWHGSWQEAEAELETAYDEIKRFRPGVTAMALIRLAKLRVRQGRLDEAQQLLTHVEHHPLAQLVLAELALERHDPHTAVETGERFLRRIPTENLIEQANCLEVMIRAYAALGQREPAMMMLGDLAAVAEVVKTKPLEASLSFSNGLLAVLDNACDLARRYFEDAVDVYLQCGAIFETSLARIELARTLLSLNRPDAAVLSAQRARDDLEKIGAALLAGRATDLIAKATAGSPRAASQEKSN